MRFEKASGVVACESHAFIDTCVLISRLDIEINQEITKKEHCITVRLPNSIRSKSVGLHIRWEKRLASVKNLIAREQTYIFPS
jgi:hypothetical protein